MIKSRTLLCLLALLMLVSGGVLSGCGGGGESNAMEGMKWLPATGDTYMYGDLAALREPQYSTVYRGLASEASVLAEFGISSDNLSWEAVGESAVVFGGNFDFDGVRKKLDEGGSKGSYRGVEVWTGLTEGVALALRSGRVIVGDSADSAYECIDVIQGVEQSYYDNSELREAANRIPPKALLFIAATAGDYFPADLTDCDAVAYGYDKIDAETTGATFIAKFRNANTARDSLSDFKSWITMFVSYNLENVQAVREGEFAKVTATFPVSEWRAE